MNIKNKNGPRLKPCWTPEVAKYSFDSKLPYFTNWLVFNTFFTIS